jgi:hypothetical protein
LDNFYLARTNRNNWGILYSKKIFELIFLPFIQIIF